MHTYRIHLEVYQFSSSERDHHLALIHGALHYRLFTRRFPFVHALVRADVAYPIGIYLKAEDTDVTKKQSMGEMERCSEMFCRVCGYQKCLDTY